MAEKLVEKFLRGGSTALPDARSDSWQRYCLRNDAETDFPRVSAIRSSQTPLHIVEICSVNLANGGRPKRCRDKYENNSKSAFLWGSRCASSVSFTGKLSNDRELSIAGTIRDV